MPTQTLQQQICETRCTMHMCLKSLYSICLQYFESLVQSRQPHAACNCTQYIFPSGCEFSIERRAADITTVKLEKGAFRKLPNDNQCIVQGTVTRKKQLVNFVRKYKQDTFQHKLSSNLCVTEQPASASIWSGFAF